MSSNLTFFQSTKLGGDSPGIFDLLLAQIQVISKDNLFSKIQVIVPNQAIGIWLKDKITKKNGICANIDCVVLPGAVIEGIYLHNNPTITLANFAQIKYIIYDYLITNDISSFHDLKTYLYNDDEIDNLRAFQLANQLESIYREYIYLRSDEMLNIVQAKFKPWQKEIWQYVKNQLGMQKTYIDIYSYFANLDIFSSEVKLPDNLFIFGLTSIYPSQLKILLKIAERTNVYWYYQTCSHEYYGDLLSNKARSKIEQKLLRKPDLSLDDLYLTNGNPLLANLGQQSREFTELLRAHDVQVYDFAEALNILPVSSEDSLLTVLQKDIWSLKHRLDSRLRLDENHDSYVEPITNNWLKNDRFQDLNTTQSVKINICHNRMREVQVMFNELLDILNNDDSYSCSDILITAPDIDNYASYIRAVFDSEYALNQHGDKFHLPYYITGNRLHSDTKLFETLLMILDSPYNLTVSYLLELLEQQDIQLTNNISREDVLLIKKWLRDNYTHFGYDADDYDKYGYANYTTHSFKQLLNNIVLGGCISADVFAANQLLPELRISNEIIIPYDNLDNTEMSLANKLICLIEDLEYARDLFYSDADNHNLLTHENIVSYLQRIQKIIVADDNAQDKYNAFLGELQLTHSNNVINLPILRMIVQSYIEASKHRLSLSGSITCASLQYVRNLPYKFIYVLGMNFGEFPDAHQPNQLSILADEWYIADRNYNTEGKQAFLDIILSAKQKLAISYIGRKETDNTSIKPSPVVSLLLDTIAHSCSEFVIRLDNQIEDHYDFKGLIQEHSLHPFYNNPHHNYAHIWQQISQLSAEKADNIHWDFAKYARVSPLNIPYQDLAKFLDIDLNTLVKTFSRTNANLYKVLGIETYNDEIELDDYENMVFSDRNLAKAMYKYFERYPEQNYNRDKLCQFLQNSGVIGYGDYGLEQFDYYAQRYNQFIRLRGTNKIKCEFSISSTATDGEQIELNFADEFWVDGNSIIIGENFEQLGNGELKSKLSDVPYSLKLRGLLAYALLNSQAKILQLHNIQNVVLRQGNVSGEYRDFILHLDSVDQVLQRILRYYLRSLKNPVLIHKNSINEYSKAVVDSYPNGALKNTPLQNVDKAYKVYSGTFKNYDLEELKKDAIFATIADDYFNVIAKHNGVNDIIQIGAMLSLLQASTN